MAQDQNFQARLDKIRERAENSNSPQTPELPKGALDDLGSLSRNMKSIKLSDFTGSLWDIPTFRYGLPIVIGVFGLSLMGKVASNTMTHNMMDQVAFANGTEHTAGFSPFGNNAIANEAMRRMDMFVELYDQQNPDIKTTPSNGKTLSTITSP